MKKEPFFIIGCVRSGTTLLRNILRNHPNLASPEETHFFRWAEVFGTPLSQAQLLTNQTLKKHREMDKISEDEFKIILQNSVSRGDLQKKYMARYITNNNLTATRWFDKTPQNVYGSAMIASEFPRSKFIHIVRNPMNVVSSLRIGKIVKIENLIGACNFWNEAAANIHMLKKAYPNRIYEVPYEQLTENLFPEIEKLLTFLNEDYDENFFKDFSTTPIEHPHESLFTEKEIKTIKNLCGRWGKYYGYL